MKQLIFDSKKLVSANISFDIVDKLQVCSEGQMQKILLFLQNRIISCLIKEQLSLFSFANKLLISLRH